MLFQPSSVLLWQNIQHTFVTATTRSIMFKLKPKRTLAALAISLLIPFSSAFAQNIAISNVQGTEGDAGTVNFDFPITLSAPAGAAVNLSYSTGAAGSATSGTDFVAVPAGTVTIPVGASSGVARVVVNGDLIVETQETFTVTIALQPGSPGTIVTNQALGQITNDDSAVLSVASVVQAEGNAAGTLSFTASLSRPIQGAISARIASSDDSAIAPADYASINQVLNFASGATTAAFTVASVGELVVEPNERFTLALSELTAPALLVSSVSLSAAAITGTLNNDDSAAITITSPSQLEGNAGISVMPFAISISAPVQGVVGFNAATANGTATLLGNDYQAANSALSFASLSTIAQNLNVNIVGDLTVEPDENFLVNLTGLTLPAGIPAGAVTLASNGTGTIRNEDSTTLSIANAQILEGNTGTSNLAFTASLTAPSATAITANFATSTGTAVASDFTASSGTITFTPGQLTQTINVPILGDTLLESDETFTLALSAPSGATLGSAIAIGTILNDDGVVLSINSVRGVEALGLFNFTVSLTGVNNVPVSVQFATQDGSASATSDYVANSGTLIFQPGEVSKTISVRVLNDADIEGIETFNVILSGAIPPAPGVTINPAIGVGTIENDDFVTQIPTLSHFGLLMLGMLMLVVSRRSFYAA